MPMTERRYTEEEIATRSAARRARLVEVFGLKRNIVAVSAAMLIADRYGSRLPSHVAAVMGLARVGVFVRTVRAEHAA